MTMDRFTLCSTVRNVLLGSVYLTSCEVGNSKKVPEKFSLRELANSLMINPCSLTKTSKRIEVGSLNCLHPETHLPNPV